jgi:16S rRNA processing protein RimM
VLSEIIQTGANDVYVVTPESGKDVLFPVIQSVVKEIDIEMGKIIVDPPDWY